MTRIEEIIRKHVPSGNEALVAELEELMKATVADIAVGLARMRSVSP